MTVKAAPHAPALFLPHFLGRSALDLGASALFFDQIGFDIPAFLQRDVLRHFDESGLAARQAGSSAQAAFALSAELFGLAQREAQRAHDALVPLFDSGMFLKVGMVHFIMRSGREWLLSKTGNVFASRQCSFDVDAMLRAAAREFVWHVHEAHLEFGGDVRLVLQYVEQDFSRYRSPPQFLASFVCHRLPAFQDNPGPVITNEPFMLNALAVIGETDLPQASQRAPSAEGEYLSFVLFDSLVRPFAPRLDRQTAEKLVELRMKRGQELVSLRKHVRDMAVDLLQASSGRKITQTDVEACVSSLQNDMREVLQIDGRALKLYFQSMLEDKSIWIGVAGLVATLSGGLSPLVPATFGVTALSAMGAGAVKAKRRRKELLDASQTRFLYYLDRAVGKRRNGSGANSRFQGL